MFHCSVTQETRVQFPASVFFGVSLRVDPKVLGRVDPKGLGRVHGSKGAGASAWIQRGWGECMDPASGSKGAGASGSKGVGARYEKQFHCNVNVIDPKKVFHQISFRCSI